MEITEAVKTCLSKSFKLDGRASRSEYWYFVLFQFCLYFVGIAIMSLSAAFQSDSGLGIVGGLFLLVGLVLLYFCVLPSVADNEFGECPCK